MAEILKSMELINHHNKTWSIEIESESEGSENAIIRTCFNHGKITEKVFQGTPYDRNNKYIQKVMTQLRKGYIYNNPSMRFAVRLGWYSSSSTCFRIKR